jgi:hypothetical protein
MLRRALAGAGKEVIGFLTGRGAPIQCPRARRRASADRRRRGRLGRLHGGARTPIRTPGCGRPCPRVMSGASVTDRSAPRPARS